MTRVHPVQLRVERPGRTSRVQLFIRLLLLLAVAALGYSAIYWALYLALPAVAALLVLKKGEGYLGQDGPRIVRVLRWFASAYGYLWLLTDVLPTTQGSPVDLQVTPGGTPTATSALLRIVTSIPAILLVIVLSAVASLAWIVSAFSVLISERVPEGLADFMALALRVQFRLIAYHLSLVDRYPSLASSSLVHATA